MSRLEPLGDYRLDEPERMTPHEQFVACNNRERWAYSLATQGGDMNVKQIVIEWLKQHGYDGLYDGADCACEIRDLMPCMGCSQFCKAGYKKPCAGPVYCHCGGDHDFHIGPREEGTTTAPGCGGRDSEEVANQAC